MIKERLNDKWARMITVAVIALIIGITGDDPHRDGVKNLFISFIVSVCYVSCYWELNRLFFDFLIKKLPDSENYKKRLFVNLGFMVGFVLLAGTILDVINFAVPGITNQIYFLRNYNKSVERSLFCLGIITVLFEMIYFLSLYERSRLENLRLREEAAATVPLKEEVAFKSRFLVKSGETYTTVILSDIAYFNYESKLTFLYTTAGKRYMLDNSLDELEKALDPKLFFRLNRQYLSSFAAIKSVHNYFNSKLRIHLIPEAPEEVTVSKERAGSLKVWLGD